MGKYYVVCAELGIFGEKVGIFAGRLNNQNRPDGDYSEVTDEAVKAAAEYLLHEKHDFYFSHNETGYIMRVVRDEPELDEPGARHAHWVNDTWCSNCSRFPVKQGMGYDNRELTKYFERCPHCGAKMDGGAET